MHTVSFAMTDSERSLALLRGAKQRDGLDPRHFMMALSDAVEHKAWEHMPDGPISFHEFIARADLTPRTLRAALALPAKHEEHIREEHERWVAEDTQ